MEDYGIDVTPITEQTTPVKPVAKQPKFKPVTSDRRYKFHIFSDAFVIAPRKDRQFADDVVCIITNITKIERRPELEEKKSPMLTQIYDIDEIRLEVEYKPLNGYSQPRMITVINRKTKKIVDRITKPYLVNRVNSILMETYDKIMESMRKLETARAAIQKLSEYQAQK